MYESFQEREIVRLLLQCYSVAWSYHHADPYRLIYGVDSWGNTCGRRNPELHLDNVTAPWNIGRDFRELRCAGPIYMLKLWCPLDIAFQKFGGCRGGGTSSLIIRQIELEGGHARRVKLSIVVGLACTTPC